MNLLQTTHVQSWINDMSKNKKLAPKTIRNVFNILNAAMKKAVVLQMIQRNPCDGAVLPKGTPAIRDVYSTTETNVVLQATKGSDVHIIAVLGLTVGLCRSELAAPR
jgi:integrase